jgi:hypothetical protein
MFSVYLLMNPYTLVMNTTYVYSMKDFQSSVILDAVRKHTKDATTYK